MRLNLITLQITLTFLNGCDYSGVSAVETFHAGSGFEAQNSATLGRKLSPVGNFLLKHHDEKDANELLRTSNERFDKLTDEIDRSVQNGNLIYIEDGEADDHWQSLLGALDGIAPELVVTRGGYYKVRQDLTSKSWDRFHKVAGKEKPKISPIHGSLEKFGKFDRIEGTPIYDEEELSKLRLLSRDSDKLSAEIQKTKRDFAERLRRNEFTTVVTKCAPTGLAELIVDARAEKKVAIIWTGFMRFDPEHNTFQAKFNVRKDLEASRALLKLPVPIIITTPRLQNSELGAIVASEVAHIYAAHSKDVPDTYKGFEKIHGLVSPNRDTFAFSLTAHWDLFRDQKMNEFQRDEARLSQLDQRKRAGQAVDEEELMRLRNSLEWSQGKKWKELEEAIKAEMGGEHAAGAPFRDFCPIDQYAHPILKNSIRGKSVEEVLTADAKFYDNDQLFNLTPSPSANLFIVTKFDSEYLRRDMQRSLEWMAAGEPLERYRIPT